MRVLVGISGGVDSSVSALILKEKGYEVVGVSFVFTDDYNPTDASLVCAKLGIEHHILDYKEEFKEKVIDKFISDYKQGLTPNPCVLCNKNMKMKLLYEKMKEYNCDFISTGHYAKITDKGLYLSKDSNKDQTYFLCSVKKEILEKLIFPLEGITKEEVRKIAREHNLVTAEKKDSTDVCFITEGFKKFISDNIKSMPGDVIDIDTKKVIGTHIGLMYYTIGQRRGLNIGGYEDRMFVVGKNLEKNILYISRGSNNDALISTSCIVEDFNYFALEKVRLCKAKFRYRQELIDVEINFLSDDKIEVKYKDGQKAVTPGQACVLYKDNECLGGGVIKEVFKDGEKLWYL